MANYFLTGVAKVNALINTALSPINSAISALQTAIGNVYTKTQVYTKEETGTQISTAVSSANSHIANSGIHVTAQNKEDWDSKYDSSTAYNKTQCDTNFAVKSVESTVASLQTGKADKSDTYTKAQVNTLVASMTGKSFNYSDWSNGALASAIKELYTALGGTIVQE